MLHVCHRQHDKGGVGMTTAVFTKTNHPGSAMLNQTNASWATLRAASAAIAVSTFSINCSAGYYLYRAFATFNTSTIPLGAIIDGWSLALTRYDPYLTFANANSTRIEVIPSTQVDPTSLATTDYDNISFVSKGNRNLADFAVTGNTYSITGTGMDIVVPGGWTKMCLTMGRDLDNVAPTGDNSIGLVNAELTVEYHLQSIPSTSISDENGVEI